MPWARHIVAEPPPANQMEAWEAEGWEVVTVLGPAPAVEDKPGAKPRMVYVVYLRRSIIALVPPARGRAN